MLEAAILFGGAAAVFVFMWARTRGTGPGGTAPEAERSAFSELSWPLRVWMIFGFVSMPLGGLLVVGGLTSDSRGTALVGLGFLVIWMINTAVIMPLVIKNHRDEKEPR